MSGQNGAGQIVETAVAGLAAITLALPLRVVMPITGDRRATTMGAPNAVRPTVLPNQVKALRVVRFFQHGRQVHQHGCGHRSPRGSHPTKPLQPPSAPLIAACRLCRDHPGTRHEPTLFTSIRTLLPAAASKALLFHAKFA